MTLPLIELMQKDSTTSKIATIIDIRSLFDTSDNDADGFSFSNLLKDLRARGIETKVMFIDAKDEELVRRFEKVRRPHPLQSFGFGSIVDGIKGERERLKSLKNNADYIIDTTNYSIHDFSRKIVSLLSDSSRRELKIHVMSFGFKHGLPIDAEFVFDMRFLPNPFWVEGLKNKTGIDGEVADYVLGSESSGITASQFLDDQLTIVCKTFAGFLHENKQNITLAFGCTGGRHRSVACAEHWYNNLRNLGYNVSITHRDIDLGD